MIWHLPSKFAGPQTRLVIREPLVSIMRAKKL